MCLYLTKRTGGMYYFRRAIPDELRPAFDGRTEFMFSLRTKDKDVAKRKRDLEAVKTTALLEDARARLSPPAAPAAAPTVASRALTERELAGVEYEAMELAAKDARRDELSDYIAFLEERLKGSTEQMPKELRAFRYILEGREFDHGILEDQLRIASAKLREAEQRLADPQNEMPSQSPGEAPQGRIGAEAEQSSGIMLDTTIVDLWAAERKVVQKGIDTHRAVARWFYERVGKKPVGDITRKDVLAFKDALIAEGQSAANTNMKLSRLRTLLQWAFDNDYAQSNVAKGIQVKDTDAAKNKRKEFDLASLNAIFGSPVFAEGARPAGGKGEAAYWLPLLALFTGARLEELGQLRPSDVVKETYPNAAGMERSAWFINIQENKEEGLKLKNAVSERRVPVHPELERLGFVKFVEAAKKAKRARLFHLLKADKYGRLSAKWGEWFSTYRREVCGVTDRRLVFHSFRHTFKHYARHAGIIEGVQRQIMGHSPGDVADEYGSGYSLYQLVEGMKLYKVPGLKLPR